jgi:hypothetical protein
MADRAEHALPPLDGAPMLPGIEPLPVGWNVSIQDWRARPPGSAEKAPPVTTQWFATKAEADERKRRLRELNQQPEFLLCVTPAVRKRAKPKTIAKPHHKGPLDAWR